MPGMSEILLPSTSRLSRWSWIAPYVAVGVFALTMLLLVGWLQQAERDSHQLTMERDVHWAGQILREHLQANEEALVGLAREVMAAQGLSDGIQQRARLFLGQHPEFSDVLWLGVTPSSAWAASGNVPPWLELLQHEMPPRTRDRNTLQADYRGPEQHALGIDAIMLQMPVWRGQQWLGTWVAVYERERLLRHLMPAGMTHQYLFTLLSPAEVVREDAQDATLTVPLTLPSALQNWQLRASALPQQGLLVHALPTAMIVSLSLIIMWSLWLLREHIRRREQVEVERDRLFSLSLDLLCVLGRDGVFRRCNRAFQRILGYAAEDLPGRSLLDIIHSDEVRSVMDRMQALSRGEPIHFESRCRCKDGSFKWLVWSINPVQDEGLVYGVAHDITSRKAAEEALRAESTFRKAMEDSVITGLRAIDLTGRIIYVNSAFCRLVGFDEDELVGRSPPFPYWPEETFEECQACLAMSLKGQAPAGGFEMRIRRKNGERIDARFYLSPLIDLNGNQTGWMASITDITEPKRVRAALEIAQQRFETVLDTLEASVFVADVMSDEILFANRAFQYIHGFDAVGRTTHSVAVPQPDRSRYPVALSTLDANEWPMELFDGELQHPLSGRWYHVREHATRWVDGRVVRMGMATDITDRRQSAEVTREQAERLQHTSRLVTMGEMASSLAHELNQPLAAIANYCMGSVTRLQSGQYRESEVLAAMQKASAQAERAGKIIRRVREFVKKSEPRRRFIHLSEVLENAIAFVDLAARRVPGHVRLEVPVELPPVYADQIMIEQVMINLVGNGLDAMVDLPEDARVLVVQARVVAPGEIEIAVIDRGHGIGEEERKQMFSPFYTTKSEGMGLGLNICRSIIEFHNSSLQIASNPEGGTIFTFTLPTEMVSEHGRDFA